MLLLEVLRLKTVRKQSSLSRGLSTLLFTLMCIAGSSANATGLGFFVTSDGYFVTNYQTIVNTGAYNVAILDKFGNQFSAAIVATDVANDLALLKAKGSFAAIPIAKSSVIEIGDRVFAIVPRTDAKQGRGTGLIKATVSSLSGVQGSPNVFAIAVSSTSSGFGGIGGTGGPLLTSEGNAIGIMAMPHKAKLVLAADKGHLDDTAFAIKSDYLLALLASRKVVMSQLQPLNVASTRTHGQVAKQAAPAIGVVTSSVGAGAEAAIENNADSNPSASLVQYEAVKQVATKQDVGVAPQVAPAASVEAMYQTGHKALQQQDYPVAYHWLQQAAEQGHAKAQSELASMYLNGQGTDKDALAASQWLRKAALQGDANAGESLGILFRDGVGVEQDEIEAAWWFARSAKQGSSSAQANLGLMYEDGRGVSQSDAEAVQWFKRAAEQGNTLAQYRLGIHYMEGRGVVKDQAEAAKWLTLSAKHGFAQAQDYLRAGTRVP